MRKLLTLLLFFVSANAFAQFGPPQPPWGPASAPGGTYTINWHNQGTTTYLQEMVGGSGWVNVSTSLYQFSTSYYVNFTNKAPGQYYYRLYVGYTNQYGTTWSGSNQILVTVTGPLVPADSLPNQRNYTYETRRGDLNGDGRLDLFVNRTSGGQPGNGSLGKFILQQLTNGSFSLIDPNASQTAAASAWTPVTTSTALEDINYDGFADIVLGKLYEIIPGAVDQVVYAPAQSSINAPKGVKAVDATFRKFLGDLTSWIAQPRYFENTAPIVQVPVYGYVWQCDWYYDYEYGWYEDCYWAYVFLGYVAAYDFGGFSQPAVQFKRTFDEVGQGPLGSTRAGIIKQILDTALGVPTGLGISVPADDVIWIPWPDTNGERSPWLARFLFRLNLILTIAQLSGDTPNFDYYHHTPATAAILASGVVLPSSDGFVYLTRTLYASAQQARSLLALSTLPTHAFILMSREMGPPMPTFRGPVQGANGQPGGGLEWVRLGPIPVGPTPRVVVLGP